MAAPGTSEPWCSEMIRNALRYSKVLPCAPDSFRKARDSERAFRAFRCHAGEGGAVGRRAK
eukprot:15454433-Alexandrium_andersonii.AAC.1